MLQNNPTLSLQAENENRIAQQRHIQPPLFRDSNIITIPPTPSNYIISSSTARIPYPVTSINSIGSMNSPISFIPRTGLDFLHGLASIHIQQTYELNDMHSSISSENRFTVRTPNNEAIFAASESSTAHDRMCLGASRPFTMHLLDKTNQEALTLYRRLPCSFLCCYFKIQVLEVWSPPGDFIGTVQEKFSFFSNDFVIKNVNSEILFHVIGPSSMSCFFPKEAHFKILSADLLTQKGTISRIWNNDLSTHCLNIYFANSEMDVRTKALFTAVGFLLEYKFFQASMC